MKIYVDSGLGDGLPKEVVISNGTTVGQFRNKYASEFNVPSGDVQIVNDLGTTLNNDKAKLSSLVENEDTVHITPRAKAGC